MSPISKLARAKTTDYVPTINGLLTKRAELFNEAIQIRNRLAEIKNDMKAIDRSLGTLGYKGDIDAIMPRKQRNRIFRRGELMRTILTKIRHADQALTSREIACLIAKSHGIAPNDVKYIDDMTQRVRKTLKRMREQGVVHSAPDETNCLFWTLQG